MLSQEKNCSGQSEKGSKRGDGVIAQLLRHFFHFSLRHHKSNEEGFAAHTSIILQPAGLELIQDAVLPHSAAWDCCICSFR